METISRAIWGDNAAKEEPRNGVTGDVSKGEPYDAGNIGEHLESKEDEEPTTDDNYTTSKELPTNTASTNTTSSKDMTSKDMASNDMTSKDLSSKDVSREEPATKEVPHASEVKDSSLTTGDHSKAQNDTRAPSDPHTNPESADTKAKQNVDDTEGTDDSNNPVKIDGPGPKPIADVAKDYGGDAGNAPSSDSVDKKGASGDSAKKEEAQEEEEDGPQKVSHGEGTGEKWVKSSGLKADGGDFDASAPGAGREADRLLEEKGVHREEKPAGGPAATSTDSVDSKESGGSGKTKTSLKDKIKAKLHKS